MAVRLNARTNAPGLTSNDLLKSIHFYEALGFEVTQRNERDGKLAWVMLKAGGCELGLGQDDFAKGKDRQKGQGMRMWIPTSQDLQPLVDQIKKAGYTLDDELAKQPWGPMGFSISDPDGFKITISGEM